MDPSTATFLLAGGAALLAAATTLVVVQYRREASRLRREADERAAQLLADARRQADELVRESRLLANEEVLKLREQTEQFVSKRRLEIDESEKRVADRERLVNLQLERLVNDEDRLRQRSDQLQEQSSELGRQISEQNRQRSILRDELARVAGLTQEEAKDLILRQTTEETKRDAADLTRHILEDAQIRAEERARHVLATVIQRYAGEYTFESTSASVAINNDEIKGRIIGREGRNIRAFETATGVTVLIDDTPNAVVISGFDPVRRAIAREAMSRLIADGRIHPTRIEEVVAQVQREMDDSILRLGEEAVAKLGLAPVHVETARLLGRLRFRHSYSQNILDHSIEVARLSGLIAAELGGDIESAKRAGLLHDIGKAVTHEIEGPH
ncbi:MAG: Rnase Y domain-containing protein, partial [Limisphaerales bacterium]